MRFLLSLIILILVLGGLVFGFSYWFKSRVKVISTPEIPSGFNLPFEFHPSLPSVNFHELGFASVCPAEISFYLESSNFKNFLSLVPDSPLALSLGKDLEVVYDDLFSQLEPRFAIIQKNENLGLVFKLLDPQKVTPIVESLKLQEGWAPYFIGDYLIFSAQPNLFSEIEMAFKKRSLPLNLNSSFQQSVGSLPKNGLIFLYSPLREKSSPPATFDSEFLKILPKGSRGLGFVVVQKEDSTYFIQGEAND